VKPRTVAAVEPHTTPNVDLLLRSRPGLRTLSSRNQNHTSRTRACVPLRVCCSHVVNHVAPSARRRVYIDDQMEIRRRMRREQQRRFIELSRTSPATRYIPSTDPDVVSSRPVTLPIGVELEPPPLEPPPCSRIVPGSGVSRALSQTLSSGGAGASGYGDCEAIAAASHPTQMVIAGAHARHHSSGGGGGVAGRRRGDLHASRVHREGRWTAGARRKALAEHAAADGEQQLVMASYAHAEGRKGREAMRTASSAEKRLPAKEVEGGRARGGFFSFLFAPGGSKTAV
jgi:hypothetical protein